MIKYSEFNKSIISFHAFSKGRFFDASITNNKYQLQINYIVREDLILEIGGSTIDISEKDIFIISQKNNNRHKLYYNQEKPTWHFHLELYSGNLSQSDIDLINSLPLIIKELTNLTPKENRDSN